MRTLWLGVAVGIAVTALGVGSAQATTYYVAQTNPQATDDNPGTEAQPWKTIGRSLTTLKAGDTLYVRAGVYREMVMLASNGWTFAGIAAPPFAGGKSFAQPIRFLACPGEEVVIKGSDVVTGWKPCTNAIWVADNWTYNSQQVFCDGAILQQMGGVMVAILQENWNGPYMKKGFKDMEPGSFFYDIPGKKLYVWLKDGSDPNAHAMEAGARPFLFTVGVDFIQIAGFKMTHGDVGSVVNWPSVHINGAFDVLEDCEVTWCDYIAVNLGGHDNIVRRCKLNHNGNAGMCGSGWGNQVLDTQLAWNNYRRWNAGWGAGGMKIIPYAHGWIVSGCVAEHNMWSDGIWFDSYNENVTIQNCIMRFNDGAGLHYEISDRAIIRNNIAYENKSRGIYLSNSANCMVLHNVCYRNGGSGIVAHGINRPGGLRVDAETGYEPARNNIVWGNIMIDNCDPELCPKEPDHTGRPWTERPELILPDPRISSDEDCSSDYNIFFRSDGRPIRFWENWAAGVYTNLAEWQAKTGNDRHSRIVEPLFVNLAERDFHPAQGSPAIQFVRPDVCIQFDADGKQRPMWKETFLTAGPFEAPDEFLTLPAKLKTAEAVLRPIPLPDAATELAGDGQMAQLAEALKALPIAALADGRKGAELQGIPFVLSAPAKAIVLNKQRPRVLIPVNLIARELSVLQAVLTPGTGTLSRCAILRQDGMVVPLRWVAGQNIAPSVGPWRGTLTNEPPEIIGGWQQDRQREPNRTQVAWEGKAGETPVRLFLTTWQNKNEWLPVREMEWVLEDDAVTVVILGVTVRAGK